MDVLLSLQGQGYDRWGERFVKRQPLSRKQVLVGPTPTVGQAKDALIGAIRAAGPGGRLFVNVGHGAAGGDLSLQQGMFDLAPNRVLRVGGPGLANCWVNAFYDTNTAGPPSISDMENDVKNNPTSQRLANWRIYQEIAAVFKATKLQRVVLLTCRVGNATEFLRKVANDWGTVIQAYTVRVELTTETIQTGKKIEFRYYLGLQDNPPTGKSAAELVIMEEEIPVGASDTFVVGPPLSN
jgi:hypothetical protein